MILVVSPGGGGYNLFVSEPLVWQEGITRYFGQEYQLYAFLPTANFCTHCISLKIGVEASLVQGMGLENAEGG